MKTAVLKAITIHQPYAWAVAAGLKNVENRSWPTSYRGPLLIHAGRSRASLGVDLPDGLAAPEGLPLGCLVGAVTLLDCVPMGPALLDNPWAGGPWCFMLGGAVRFARPLPWTGQVGLWGASLTAAQRRALGL